MAGRFGEHGRGGGAGSRPVRAFGSAVARRTVPWLVALTLAAPLLAGCRAVPPDAATAEDPAADGATPSPREDTMADVPSDSLRLDLIVPDRVASGERVEMRLRVENVAGRPLDLYLLGRTIAFDLVVEDEAGVEAWSRLHDQVLQQILRIEHLAPGDTLVLADTWTQRSNAGDPVPPGRYRVRGEIFTQDEPLTAGPVPLTITEEG